MLLLVALTACWEPSVTGPSGMAGVVVDPHGVPVVGLRVESVEQGELTDENGAFSVSYKEPSQYVMLKQGQTWYRRAFQPEDEGELVRIELPATVAVDLRCDVPVPCALALKWALPGGLTASVNERCEPGSGMALTGVPEGAEPSVSCRATGKGDSVPVELAVREGAWSVLPQPSPVRVQLAIEGSEPGGCEVTVGGRTAEPSGARTWVGRARGGESVVAWCDGVPTVPVALSRPPEDGVELVWTGEGVELELGDAVELHIVREGDAGWAIVSRSDNGRFALPPLPAGRYRLATDAALLLGPPAPVKDERPGVAVFQEGRGILRLERDRVDGRIDVENL